MTQHTITGNALLVLAHAHIGKIIRADDRGMHHAMTWLQERGYIMPATMPPLPNDCFEYRLTAKGDCFVHMLLSTPHPVQSWCDPRTGNKST